MSNGQYENKRPSGKTSVWLVVGLCAAVLLILVLIIPRSGEGSTQATYPRSEDSTMASIQTTGGVSLQTGESETQTTEESADETTLPEAAEAAEVTEKTEETTEPEDVEETPPASVELIQQADAEYERWLAAAMLIGVSMEYPDFEFSGVYAASSTALENKADSAGVYLLFTSGGQAMALHSVALETERTEAGTRDISTQNLGFASFDLVDPSGVDTGAMTEIKLEELSNLIAQSLLVSVYTH